MFILTIETSTRVCSVALHEANQCLACYEVFTEKSHSAVVTSIIDNILKDCCLLWNNVSAIATSRGPGSYTGLRIGATTVKGLCFALDKPLIAIDSLHSMALQMSHFNPRRALLCPMLDARRQEVFTALYQADMLCIQAMVPHILSEHSFSEYLQSEPVLFGGDGAAKAAQLLAQSPYAEFRHDVYPSARYAGVLAWEAFQKNMFENLAYFEPYYKDYDSQKQGEKAQ